MSVHPHIEVPQPVAPPKHRYSVLPITCLALAALAGITYAAFVYHPVTSFELPTIAQGGPVVVAPITDTNFR